ncbi:MAG: sigma 54-interacting transcriptional regulator [Desulfobacteraceae bacterium]
MKPTDPGADQAPPDQADRLKQFQQYIFGLSAVFISMPATQVAAEIDKRLQEIGTFWDFDQIILTRLADRGAKLKTIHAYNAEGIDAAAGVVETAFLPWLMKIIHQGQPVVMTRVQDELPVDALSDRRHLESMGVKSSIILPFIVGGSVQGGLYFNTVRHHRIWPQALLHQLQYLGQILAGALERQKAFEQIRYSMRFDRLLYEISATYINLPARDIVRFIQKDLGRLGSFLKAERCLFYLSGSEEGTFEINDTYNWWREEDEDHIKELQVWIRSNPNFYDHFEYCFNKWSKGEIVKFSRLDELPPEAHGLKAIHERFGTRSWLSIPIFVGGVIVGALVVATTRKERVWPEELIPRLRLFGEIFANAIKRKDSEESLQKAFLEIKDLKRQVEADYVYLRDELTLEHNFEEIIGQSDVLKAVLVKVQQVAPTDSAVLISGETGTGKELIARAIHHASRRSERPLIKVNCATLTPNLIESELFGHEKGAFTGADGRRVGRFELAHGATLFLDEIGELPLELQPKLLRVLQEGEFERLGGHQTIRVDVRIIAATNRNLEKEVERGRFRSDLWYRLNAFPISIPPLRERLEDIPLFVHHFVNKYSTKMGKRFNKIPKKAVERLGRYAWPGNIRELDNIIARAVITSEEGKLQIQIPESSRPGTQSQRTFREMEKTFILQVLEKSGWKIEGRTGAANRLDIKPSTLRYRMKKLQIFRPNA